MAPESHCGGDSIGLIVYLANPELYGATVSSGKCGRDLDVEIERVAVLWNHDAPAMRAK